MSSVAQILLHLTLCPEVGLKAIHSIITGVLSQAALTKNEVLGSAKIIDAFMDLYQYQAVDLQQLFLLPQKLAEAVVVGLRDKKALLDELEKCDRFGIQIVSCLDEEYPRLLSQIAIPPVILFIKGQLIGRDAPMLAVVGSRAADEYGKHCVAKILPKVIQQGWVIVSGGALGIDSCAHQAALEYGGKTIVVSGCGQGSIYPLQNRELFAKVVASGGSIVSIFPFDTPPTRSNFPVRNRVIAGLCAGTLVVSAAKESGSLITAKYALEENREVLAVPGPFDAPLSEGCHELLRAGAKLVTGGKDVAEAFEFMGDFQLSLNFAASAATSESANNHVNNISLAKQIPSKFGADGGIVTAVWAALDKAKTSDELVRDAGVAHDHLIDLLFELELDGKVVQHLNGTWERS